MVKSLDHMGSVLDQIWENSTPWVFFFNFIIYSTIFYFILCKNNFSSFYLLFTILFIIFYGKAL